MTLILNKLPIFKISSINGSVSLIIYIFFLIKKNIIQILNKLTVFKISSINGTVLIYIMLNLIIINIFIIL